MGSNCSSRFSSKPAPHIVVQNVQSMFHVMESRNKEQMHEQFGERDSQRMCKICDCYPSDEQLNTNVSYL